MAFIKRTIVYTMTTCIRNIKLKDLPLNSDWLACSRIWYK